MWFGPDGLPFNNRYCSGTPIEDDVIALRRKVFVERTPRKPRQAGDLTLVDDIARAPDREVLMAMGELVRLADCSPIVAPS
ncbi:hypothetical protein SAMN05216215_1010110 [Saccharopolyspora shandongensis]|uniref:Uncharacterized protein n=1 Tax=Saccharopolyspora shandongensis TaxID=418495 RepID=A0A1H3B9N2_9PSEU|nr:hypothetical protein [Saccharopolyspora shandongensis]SDX38505.1 hypothetical protein SAMN05216215_1010110 [Saccharopolyspora shandongensis]